MGVLTLLDHIREDIHNATVPKKVRLARAIINSGLFSERAITEICVYLGFSDTVFKEKKAKDKLNDFLLDEEYWKELIRQSRFDIYGKRK